MQKKRIFWCRFSVRSFCWKHLNDKFPWKFCCAKPLQIALFTIYIWRRIVKPNKNNHFLSNIFKKYFSIIKLSTPCMSKTWINWTMIMTRCKWHAFYSVIIPLTSRCSVQAAVNQTGFWMQGIKELAQNSWYDMLPVYWLWEKIHKHL